MRVPAFLLHSLGRDGWGNLDTVRGAEWKTAQAGRNPFSGLPGKIG